MNKIDWRFLLLLTILGLLIHLVQGHSLQVILSDWIGGVVVLLMAFAVILTIVIWRIPKDTWERNRRASKLIRKNNRGKLMSASERAEFDYLTKEGIIKCVPAVNTRRNEWCLYASLSRCAWDQ